MKKQFGIVIAEDYTLLREGIKALISCETDLKVVGEVEDGLEAIRSVREHSPDLVLMDLSMPRMNGIR
jgi:YesN/AraC family two-component response regulator